MVTRTSLRLLEASVGRVAFLVLACASLTAGCGQISMPLGSADVETPMVITGSISSSTDVASVDIDKTDRSVIAKTLDVALQDPVAMPAMTETAEEEGQVPEKFAWQNTASGNSGTVSQIDKEMLAETGCLSFRTTANTIAGVRIYSGTACRDGANSMVITSLAVDAA